MIKIIGHRGARALAQENSIAGIKAAIAAGVDGIEFDVRLTADKQLVLSHDANMERVWGIKHKISSHSLKEHKQLTKEVGQPIPTLAEALTAAGNTPVIIECKGSDWAKPLSRLLNDYPKKSKCTVIAFNHHELFTFGQYCPNVPLYGLEQRNPFDALNDARIFGFEGIDVSYWVLNPLVYLLAKRHKLDVVVYTINRPWIASLYQILYPGISITTDNPQKMQFLRPRPLRIKSARAKPKQKQSKTNVSV